MEMPGMHLGMLLSFVHCAGALASARDCANVSMWPLVPGAPHILFFVKDYIERSKKDLLILKE